MSDELKACECEECDCTNYAEPGDTICYECSIGYHPTGDADKDLEVEL